VLVAVFLSSMVQAQDLATVAKKEKERRAKVAKPVKVLTEEDGKEASVEIGGDIKLPAWVPHYPGSHPEGVVSAKGSSDREAGEAGVFTFKTPDSREKVVEFYEQKARDMGLQLHAEVFGTVIAGSEDRGDFLKIVATGGSDETKVTVTYKRKL